MMSKKASVRAAASVLLLSLLLSACGEKPEAMLASAKDYLAKNDNKAAVIQIKNALQANPDLPEARFLLGTALLDSGDAVGAETELRKALSLKHPEDQVIPLLARALMMQGQAQKLTDEFSKVSLTEPTSKASLNTYLATAFAMQGKAEQSKQSLGTALQADPTYAPAKILQARQKAVERDFDGALVIADDVVAKSPKNHDAWKLKGDILLYGKNQPDAALVAYQKSVDGKADFLAGHAAVTTILFQQGKLPEAKNQIETIKKFAPNHPQAKYLEAQWAFQTKDFTLSRELLQQVLKATPNNVQSLQLAGVVELQLNSAVQAEVYLAKALQLSPQLPLARRMLAMTYLRTGQTSKALATLQPGLNQPNPDPELLSVAGEAYLQNGDIKKAQDFFAKAASKDPKNVKKRTSLALSQMMDGQVGTAFNDLQDIAASDAGVTADLALISAHLRRQEFDKALKAIAAYEKKQPDKPMAAMLQGRTLLAKRDPSGARLSFERALSIDPNYFPAVASLAALDMTDKKPDSAKKRFEAVVAKDPKNGQALLALAELAARSGAAKDEVAKLISNAVAANPTDAAPRLLLVDFHLRNQDIKLATSAAQDAVAALPNSPEVLDMLGRTQQAAGELNQALTTYGKLATMLPQSPQPHMRLADLHMAAKNKDAAAQSLRKALEIKPDLQQAQRGAIMLDVDGKNFQGAIATARTMQKQGPADAVGYALEGDINAAQKNWNAAATAYRDGLKQVSAPELAIKLHSVLLASNKPGEADKVAASWQRDNPKDVAFLLYLADGSIANKDFGTAEKQYLTVIKIQPNNALAYNNLAWVTGKLNKSGAVAYAEKANTLAPNQPALMDTLAVLLSDAGDYAKAAELQGKVLVLQPQNPMFRLNLAKIHIKGGKKDLAKKELDEIAKLGEKFNNQAEVTSLLSSL